MVLFSKKNVQTKLVVVGLSSYCCLWKWLLFLVFFPSHLQKDKIIPCASLHCCESLGIHLMIISLNAVSFSFRQRVDALESCGHSHCIGKDHADMMELLSCLKMETSSRKTTSWSSFKVDVGFDEWGLDTLAILPHQYFKKRSLNNTKICIFCVHCPFW